MTCVSVSRVLPSGGGGSSICSVPPKRDHTVIPSREQVVHDWGFGGIVVLVCSC